MSDSQVNGTTGTSAEGNTKTARHRKFCMTLFNYNDNDTKFFEILGEHAINWVYGHETCPTTGNKHLQCYIEFKNPRSFNAIKKIFPTAHIEVAQGSAIANFKYCTKENNFKANENMLKIHECELRKRPLEVIDPDQFYPWQSYMHDIVCRQPDTRTVYWIWEPDGCTGKTAFVKFLVHKYSWCTFSTASKSADIATIANEDITCYLFDFSRTQVDFCPYTAIEGLKNGLISDSKLKKESRNIIMNSPHVICFANSLPNIKALSEDRWAIGKIVPDGESWDIIFN